MSNILGKFKGEIFFRLFCLLAIPAWGQAQVAVHYSTDDLILDEQEKTLHGTVDIFLKNNSADTLQQFNFALWAHAYQRTGTALGKELLEDQNMGLHFAHQADLGYYEFLIFRIKGDEFQYIGDEFIVIDQIVLPGEEFNISVKFKLKLPNARFNGFGFDENTIRLSHVFPRLQKPGTATANSRNREAAFYPATYQINLKRDNSIVKTEVVSNAKLAITDQTVVIKSEEALHDLLLITGKFATIDGGSDNLGKRDVFIQQKAPFPAYNGNTTWAKVNEFFRKEFGSELLGNYQLVYLKSKKGLQSTGRTLLLNTTANTDDVEGEIVEELVKILAREKLNVNPEEHPWMVAGMANYYKHVYFERYYPEKKLLGPVAKTQVAKVMDVDHYPINQQNRMLYLFMARQGLDQPLSDPASAYARANYEAVAKGKGALAFAYLRSYVGEKNYLRAMRKWLEESPENSTPQTLIKHLQFYHNQDVSWFLGEFYSTTKKFDYALVKSENCKSVYTATVKNKGKIMAPYSITGVKKGNEVLTEWYMPHVGKKTVQIHFEDYQQIKLDAAEAMPEYTQKNNVVRTQGLFKQMQPLKLQFYNSFENPKRTQIFWLPSVKFNAYDRVLLGVQFYNQGVFMKPFEYRISPDYSTGTGQLTGLVQLRYNTTPSSGPFHLISAGMYGRYFHYAPDLGYTRLSPSLTFHFRKKYPRQEILRSIRLRGIYVNREEPPVGDEPGFAIEGPPQYSLLNLRFLEERTNVLHPTISVADMQVSQAFVRLSVDVKQRFQLSKNHLLTLRFFAGTYVFQPNNLPEYFQFGLSGTQDYLFDLPFIGRSDETGIWSNQFFVTDGGFKSETNRFYTNMQSISLNMPIYKYVGFYSNVGHVFGANNLFAWDYGLYLEFIPDFLEVYLPLQNSFQNFVNGPNYLQHVRFVLNVDLNAAVTRARRGFY